MKLEGFKNLKLKNIEESTDEEKAERTKKEEYLKEYEVNIYSYVNMKIPRHPDGIHCYAVDSYEAYKLVMNENKDLPKDLKERLLYYKKIMQDNDEESIGGFKMNNTKLNIIKLTREEHNSLHREVLNRHRRTPVWNGKKIVK